MAKTLEAHDRLIREIFEGSYKFEIPDYQRPYAWTTEQVEELFSDLIAAMQDARTSSTTSQYFLGSIVLIKNDREPKAFVVDGQQRLTTLTILFAALRATMPGAANDITQFLYKRGMESLGEKNEYRLTAREEDADFFRTYVQELGGIEQLVTTAYKLADSRLRYRENADFLLQRVRALSDADREALWRFLASDCSLVVISTPDLEAAYRIFSVLNNRGLDLAPIDILKAAVLGAIRITAGEDKSRTYARQWSQIESTLGRDAFGELFGHIRTIYAKQKQRATLVKEFQDHVTELKTPVDLMEKVVAPYSEVWNFIRDADFQASQKAESINDHLSWLNRVDFKDWVPPALLFFKRFRHKPDILLGFSERLECLTYYLLVTKAGVNDRIENYADLTKEIEPTSFDGELAALTTLQLTDKQKRDFVSALNGDIYKRLPKARMALVLRLEALKSDGSKKMTFDHLSLEHVLPQNPPKVSEWTTWFPDEDGREAWTNRLANLVPLHIRKNPAAGNYNFATKKDVYFTGKGTSSSFILTNEVRSLDQWTPASLETRQEQLLNVLKKHWHIEVVAAETVNSVPTAAAAE